MQHNQQLNAVRKSIRLIVVLTILAWAAQSMLDHWGYGADSRADTAKEAAQSQAPEKFVSGASGFPAGATLELRGEATIVGGDVKLKQICRWADADKSAFEPIADLVISRMGASVPFRAIGLAELKSTLHDAGVNLAVIRFAGTTSCTVNRGDVAVDERASLQEWVNAQRGGVGASQPDASKPTTVPSKTAAGTASLGSAQPAAAVQIAKLQIEKPEPKTNHTLRDLLVSDLAERLSLEPTSLQMKFNPIDERLLNLAEPQFRFNVDGQRAPGLGTVSWDVTIVTDSGNQKTTINANARAWQDQLVVIKPMAYHQTIRSEDLADHRMLIEHLSGDPAIKRDQAVGQMAGRELQAGTILTPRMVEAAPLVKTGQLVTVTVEQGHVQITSAARAMEGGSYGQVIKVKNEATNNIFEVTITGAQAAKLSPAAQERVAAPAAAPVANGN
jgi:flagella basal body P-ring formation protein FlgA